jgi:Capsule assembly protein Wzi
VRFGWLVLIVWLVAASPASGMSQLDVPLEHWSYEYAERLTLRAGLGRTFLDLRPLTRGEMAKLVERIDTAARSGTFEPTAIERDQLDRLRAEFSEELQEEGAAVPILQRAYHVWSGDTWRLQAFWRGREQLVSGDPDLDPSGSQVNGSVSLEPAAAVRLGTHLVGFVQVRYRVRTGTGLLVNSTDVRQGEAEYVFTPRDRVSIVRAVDPMLRYDHGWWRIGLDRTRLRWGPARVDPMLLADASPPLDALRVQLALGPVRFASVTGQVRPARLLPTDPPISERRLAAHRLSIAPTNWLDIAFSESVVYGNRGLDLAYLNPLAVLYVTQANVGDLDNALGSFDANLRLGRHGRLYGECVVDDLNLRHGLRHFGNKLGLAVGFLLLEPFGARDWDLDGEWSWASQFTYTHHDPVNRYEHYGATLGSRIGPDADLWVVGLRRRFTPGWSARLFYALERHGEGSLAEGDDTRTSDQQNYLSGVVEARHQPGVQVSYRSLRRLDLDLEYRYVAVRNAHHQAGTDLERHALSAEARVEF